jgi:hypothetical protein
MTFGKIALAALALVAWAPPSNAQRPLIPFPGSQGTPEEQAACRPDARRLCRELVGNDMAVLACFQQNRAKLSPACRAVLERHGQ